MKVTFHGAAREVTGSFHVIEADGRRVALDCGLFQGHRRESEEKNRRMPIDARGLDALILSHAHIDHAGRVPLLIKEGFTGPIYATPATRDLCAVMLADSAHIQEEDAKFIAKRIARKRQRADEPAVEPLYGPRDAVAAMNQFRTIPLASPFQVTTTLTARFHEAGHMLGSAGVRLVHHNGQSPETSVVFSGDIGRPGMPILRDPAPLPECDYLICESTYGGRRGQRNDDLKQQLGAIIEETFKQDGKIIIPAFSVGRTQVLVYVIHQLVEEGRLKDVPVYVDSPLAVNATEVFKLHPECFDAEARAFDRETGDMLGAAGCTYIRSVDQSKAINRRRKPCVIISASGMCENGRILHHLRNNVGSARNTVLIPGYQGAGTLGRRIVEREPIIRIFGQNHRLKARVEVLNGFSAHADCDELQDKVRPLARRVKQTFLVHGEQDQMEKMAARMREAGFERIVMPQRGEAFELNGR